MSKSGLYSAHSSPRLHVSSSNAGSPFLVSTQIPSSPTASYKELPPRPRGLVIMGYRFRLTYVFIALSLYGLYLVVFPSTSSASVPTSLSFCPYSTDTRHIPTLILQGEGRDHRLSNRTHWVGGAKPASFLPLSYPPSDVRIAQTLSGTPSSAHRPGKGRLGNNEPLEDGKQVCPIHRVPSSGRPEVPKKWSNHNVMFGMSTTPDRVLYNLPVWAHWLPSASKPLDPSNSGMTKDLPLVLILTPPPNPTEAARSIEAVDEAQAGGMYVEMRPKEAERFETRYFALAEDMWLRAEQREKETGIKTEWFVFADDDTFFPDFDSLVRMLSEHDSKRDVLIGALSESTKQVQQWGHLAYGGAGIYVSHGLMKKMNAPGIWNQCLAKYGASFGGDAMVSACAALCLDSTVEATLVLDDTLHQLDIRGDGTGWFQSGFLITSLHHWASWFTLFPPWHESGASDLRKGIKLVGKAAKAIGGDNWGRRYIFDDGKATVNLGYSVTIELKALTDAELEKSEHTWWEFETFHPIRQGLGESVDKRTYYITGVKTLNDAGVVRLEHKNREGERVDVIWDGRGEKRGRWAAARSLSVADSIRSV